MLPDSPEIEELKVANQEFYEAFGSLDLARMEGVWVDSERALCVHPGWPPIVGWEPIRESWRRIFENTTLMHFNIQYVSAQAQGDLGWVTCIEHITSVLQGKADNFGILSTNIFLRTPQGWRVVAHHASPGMGG